MLTQVDSGYRCTNMIQMSPFMERQHAPFRAFAQLHERHAHELVSPVVEIRWLRLTTVFHLNSGIHRKLMYVMVMLCFVDLITSNTL